MLGPLGVAALLLALPTACDDGAAPEVRPGVDLVFSMGVTDDAGRDLKGHRTLTLDWGGTADATTVVPFDLVAAAAAAPIIDGDGSDGAWSQASVSNVVFDYFMHDGNAATGAVVQAAFDATQIYFKVSWQDPTGSESLDKEQWVFDGTSWTRTSKNEDRVAFIWSISVPDGEWNNLGCLYLCHGTWMGTQIPGELVDVWHWKAHRSNPQSVSDDKWWDHVEPGRHGDEGTLGDQKNIDPAATGLPLFMAESGEPGANKTFLFDPSYAGPIPPNGARGIPFDPNLAWQAGHMIAGFALQDPAGSRADVAGKGVYSGGVWTVELKRALNTGNADDIVFQPPR